MLTKLRRVGNSRGVILPAPFLNALNLDQDIEMRLEGGRIILEAPTQLRAGWFDGYHAELDKDAWAEVAEVSTTDDWEW